ncbi:MAG: peptide-methionine (R)-S-oxide reductase MsrB, partial [Candidatus Pacebacteria bacterium]|nr:peptide-methionine (R)-S-oxide reductase MsrB [Candidatus Paceibacterota bacterium]
MEKIEKSKEDWKKELDPETYEVTRTCGTEPAFSGKWLNHKGHGVYVCSNCGLELFKSDTKFDSGTGWPSFDRVIKEGNVDTSEDTSHGMRRIEAKCSCCGAH